MLGYGSMAMTVGLLRQSLSRFVMSGWGALHAFFQTSPRLFCTSIVLSVVSGLLAPAFALATGLALVPLAVTGDIPGHEIEYPMAIVILGGLITSTLLNLFVVPSLYLRFGKSRGAQAPAVAATG